MKSASYGKSHFAFAILSSTALLPCSAFAQSDQTSVGPGEDDGTSVSAPAEIDATQETADQPQQSGVEEIVVTARRRAESLQDTPIAISAVSGEQLQQRGVTDITGVTDFVPNVTLESTAPLSGSNAAAFVFIRGVGQIDFSQQTEPGVGIYLDGVYLGRSVGQVTNTLDLERVEVLRGPQGTLFGRNTIGGAISLTTTKPSPYFEGFLDATVGNFDRIDVQGVVNIPLAENLFVRINGASINRDGYIIRQPDGLDLGDQSKLIGRVAVRWEPTDRLTVDLAVDGQRDRENGAPASLVAINTQPVSGQPTGNPPNFPAIQNCLLQGLPPVSPPCTDFDGIVGDPRFYNEQFLTDDPFVTFASGPFADEDGFRSDLDMWGAALTLAYETAFGELKSITAYRDLESDFGRDDDHSPVLVTATSNDYAQTQFSQEFQLNGEGVDGRLDYTLGLFYFQEEGTDENRVLTPVSLFRSGGSIDNESYAAFAQATFEVSESISVTGGIRYTDETKRYSPDQRYLTNPFGFPGINVEGEFGVGDEFFLIQPLGERELSFSEWTPMANISLTPHDDVLAYFTYSRGYKSGGFTQRIFPAQALVPDFAPEFVDVFELGLKVDLFDRRLRLNAAAFQTEYDDIQVVVQEGFAPQTRNAASATIRGFEVEATAVPVEGLIATFTAGFLDDEYNEIGPTVVGLTENSQFPYSPEWSLSASLSYTAETSIGSFTPRVDWSYRSSFFTDALNTPVIQQDGYHLLNATFIYKPIDSGLQFTLGVTNLTDEIYFPVASQDLAVKGSAEANFARPREWFLSARYSF